MCRMIVGAGNISVDYLIKGLQSMAKGTNGSSASRSHEDGYGIAWQYDGKLTVRKSPKSCLKNSAIGRFRSIDSDLVAMHARKAANRIRAVNYTHPFESGGYLLFHNAWFKSGSYDPSRMLDTIKEYLKPGEEEVAIAQALSKRDDIYGANCILMKTDKVVVGVRYDPSFRKPEYYQMALSQDKKGVIVSSEALPGRKWTTMYDQAVVTVKPDGTCKVSDMPSLLQHNFFKDGKDTLALKR